MKSLEKIAKGAWNGVKGLAYCVVIGGAVLVGSAKEAEAGFVPDRLFVTNTGTEQVLEVDKITGSIIKEYGPSDDKPNAVEFGPDGLLYVASGRDGTANGIYKYNSSGGSEGVITDSNIDYPTGMDFGQNGHLYVSNYGNNKIVEFDSSGVFANTFNTVTNPQDVAVDSDGDIFVPDYDNGGVIKYDSNGNNPETFASELLRPTDTEIGSNGNIFVSNQHGGRGGLGGGVYEYDRDNFSRVRKIGDEHIGGIGPIKLTLDSKKNVYISDWEDIIAYDFDGDYSRTLEGFDRPFGLAFSPIPEPATLLLLGLGSLTFLGKYKKKE